MNDKPTVTFKKELDDLRRQLATANACRAHTEDALDAVAEAAGFVEKDTSLSQWVANLVKERNEVQDQIDEQWLNEIGTQWMKLTGQPWETRDGETREEGLQSNVTALFQVIEINVDKIKSLKAERDEALAKVAEMQKAQIKFPDNLSALTVGLVLQFAQAMADKLSAAQIKHGYCDGWAETTHEWPIPECYEALMSHIKKGDPVDVANFCAFLWYHQIGTTDCGKGYVPASELGTTMEALQKIAGSWNDTDAPFESRIAQLELARLQALKEVK